MVLVAAFAEVPSRPQYFNAFSEKYPDTSLLTEYRCMICHKIVGGGTRNPYGLDVLASSFDFVSIETADSDEDGMTNIDEITAGTPPGRASADALVSTLLGERTIRDGDLDDDGVADTADVVFTGIPPS